MHREPPSFIYYLSTTCKVQLQNKMKKKHTAVSQQLKFEAQSLCKMKIKI